jgi:hypothetical protein
MAVPINPRRGIYVICMTRALGKGRRTKDEERKMARMNKEPREKAVLHPSSFFLLPF